LAEVSTPALLGIQPRKQEQIRRRPVWQDFAGYLAITPVIGTPTLNWRYVFLGRCQRSIHKTSSDSVVDKNGCDRLKL
jgi:hypothetical protein